MAERWGKWYCPYEGCDESPSDPDDIRVTCCGNDHSVLLGPVEDNGHRWAEKHRPTETDIRIAVILARGRVGI
jgi:hypothetical protein